jgi:hypothetical protein
MNKFKVRTKALIIFGFVFTVISFIWLYQYLNRINVQGVYKCQVYNNTSLYLSKTEDYYFFLKESVFIVLLRNGNYSITYGNCGHGDLVESPPLSIGKFYRIYNTIILKDKYTGFKIKLELKDNSFKVISGYYFIVNKEFTKSVDTYWRHYTLLKRFQLDEAFYNHRSTFSNSIDSNSINDLKQGKYLGNSPCKMLELLIKDRHFEYYYTFPYYEGSKFIILKGSWKINGNKLVINDKTLGFIDSLDVRSDTIYANYKLPGGFDGFRLYLEKANSSLLENSK